MSYLKILLCLLVLIVDSRVTQIQKPLAKPVTVKSTSPPKSVSNVKPSPIKVPTKGLQQKPTQKPPSHIYQPSPPPQQQYQQQYQQSFNPRTLFSYQQTPIQQQIFQLQQQSFANFFGGYDQDLPIQSPPSPPLQRAPTGQTHPLRFSAIYSPEALKSSKFDTVKRVYEIAASYFSKVLKVRYLERSQVEYIPDGPLECDNILGRYFSYGGFNQNQTDLVVGIGINAKRKPGEPTLAKAAACCTTRRVTYGVIIFYVESMGTSYLSIYNSIRVALHQMVHMLGFSPSLFQSFYTSPSSTSLRPLSQVLTQIGSQYYLSSPKVVAFVRKYFNCNTLPGALLDGSHWNSKVFREIMTEYEDKSGGGAVSGLTLALLEDTGYYEMVDYGYAEGMGWGSGRGCAFGQGLVNEDVCVPNTCDYYSKYVRNCTNGIEGPYLNLICEDSSQGMGSPNTPQYRFYLPPPPAKSPSSKYFGPGSRCFRLASSGASGLLNDPYLNSCFKAECSPDGRSITIEVNGQRGICYEPNKTVVINKTSVVCPSSFAVFCSYKGCRNYCSGRGVCLNGKCLCGKGYSGEDCGGVAGSGGRM